MNAWIQRLQQLLRVVLSLAVAGYWARAGQLALGLAVGTLLFFAYAWFLLGAFFSLRRINQSPSDGRPSWGTLLRAWWRELPACERVFSWWQPFAAQAVADALPAPPARQRGVLLIHGFSCNRGLWNEWMRRLRAKGHPYIALTLTPEFGGIDRYADPIEAAVQRLTAACGGTPPLVVAHSMGGLAVRAWWRRHGHNDQRARVQRVLTLGTPHAGTVMAELSTTRNARQMRRHSAWLQELASHERLNEGDCQIAAHLDCYFSACDQVVCPAQTAVLPGARAIEIPAAGHLSLVFEPRVFADALAYLAQPLNDARRQAAAA
ncbi:esterase/lipase family protein [Roseateles koreensis]|uniref:Alpha/beta fold hydrolase n=1 Tax=Roseateles koreensis TaxID=2987526 RepID=A0ABT5KQ16_9BURK|nr:alpha/beta fold hydrolase [Roseateles koreensis]MDC8784555.1 alpha/beta fold hydrolase [Roseateles koreensis]